MQVTRLARVATIASMPVCPAILWAIRNHPADLVHIHTPNPGAAVAFLASGHRGKLVITHHADILGRKVLRQMSRPFAYRLMQRASRIVVTSTRYLRSSTELAPFQEKCRVIPLGIDLGEHRPSDPIKIRELRSRFGERVVLAVGRLVPYKGFDVLIKSMKGIDATLLLIGSGPQSTTLTSLAQMEGIRGKVALLGWVDNLDIYFDVASIFVLPSITRAEAFGLVQLEAMAAGLPVINTNLNSGVPEVSVAGETGLTVAPGDVAGLSQAIQILLDRKDMRDRYARAAETRVRSHYTADLMADRTMRLYEEVLGEPAPKGSSS